MKVSDQLGRQLHIDKTPNRIISLVPSITELICDLGMEDAIVGCTKFCVHPVGLKKKVKNIGGTKTVQVDVVKEIKPDIIFANKEENLKETIEELYGVCPVWVSDVQDFKGAIDLITVVGEILDVAEIAKDMICRAKAIIPNHNITSKRVLYLIWRKPYMTIGGDTYISSMLNSCGFENSYHEQRRYPEITIEEIKELDLDYIFLSSEPFPFEKKHIEELRLHLPGLSIYLVDGEYFSWYGSRLLHCENYLDELNQTIKNRAETID